MNQQPDVATIEPVSKSADRNGRGHTIVNWVLALLTVPFVIVVLVFALGGVMSTAGCSDRICQSEGPGPFLFTVLFYGPPVVAAVTIIASFFTARRKWGIAVPLCALALLGIDLAVLAASF
jgi:hypothetical protein